MTGSITIYTPVVENSLFCHSKVKTDIFTKSVHYQESTIFKKLPQELGEETSIVIFKNKLRDYYKKT